MDKPEVLRIDVIRDMLKESTEKLEEAYQVHSLNECPDPDAFLEEMGERMVAVVTDGHVGVSAAIMEKLPNLKGVIGFGAGVDKIDFAYARSRGIQVSNTPGVLNDDVANLAIGMLLAISRDLVEADRYVRRGDWVRKGKMPLRKGIRGERVGILGLGGIGKDVAKKLEVFGCEVVYHGRNKQSGISYQYYPDLVAMARDCSYLIVVCPATSETNKIVNREVIDALGSEGTLINIARGAVVDELEVVTALQEGRLGGFASDVFEREPSVPEALFSLPNVILAPHIGSATVNTRRAMGDLLLTNLGLLCSDQPLATPLKI